MMQPGRGRRQDLPLRNRRNSGSAVLGTYSIRIMVSVALSISLMVALTHLPLSHQKAPIGWRIVAPSETMTLEQLGLETLARASSIAPEVISEDTGLTTDEGKDETSTVAVPESEQNLQEESVRMRAERMEIRRAILDFAEEMPEIVGGLGAYYINIQYPEAAAKAGIQGRLILDFVVEINGWPTNIHVTQPLHPLCDSAAVRALRATRFVPGKHNGEKVPVRFRLPVRFELIDRPRDIPRIPGES